MVKRLFTSMVFAAAMLSAAGIETAANAKDSALSTSGLPIPRYVSLKSDHVNVRAGPTKDNDVAWIYTKAGLPVEITAEFENWRRIRDSEGAEGWVYHSL
jgi:SH3-like domain-containing protein